MRLRRSRRTALLALALLALGAVVAAPAAGDSNVSIEYIDHETHGVAGYDTQMVVKITNRGTEPITDDIVYDVSRYQDASHDRQALTLQPGESRVVRLETRLATTILSYQLWDVEYAGSRYDPPDRDSGSPFYRANETLVITDIDPDKGSGGNFRASIDAPESVPAGGPINLDVSVSNTGERNATQIVTVSGPVNNDSRAFTVDSDEQQTLPISVCAPADSGKSNITVSTANDTETKTVTVTPSNGSTNCRFGSAVTESGTGPIGGLLDDGLSDVPRRVRLAAFAFIALLVIAVLND